MLTLILFLGILTHIDAPMWMYIILFILALFKALAFYVIDHDKV